MNLRFTRRAANDLAEIAGHIKAENPQAALRVRAAILESIEIIAQFPEMGRQQSVEGVRKTVARKYPYLIYYSLVADEIVVLTVQHSAREHLYQDR
jgi:plasmid stabilization system protein ParE